jgi:peroxiredoxin
MFVRLAIFLVLVLSFAGSAHANVDFGLLDQRGKFHQLSRYGTEVAVVLMPFSYDDPGSQQSAQQLEQLQQQFAEQGVVVWLLNASDEADRVRQTATGLLPVLIDSSQTVAKTLDIQVLGEMLILDPASSTIVFRNVNAVDELTPALTEWIAAKRAGRPVRFEVPEDTPSGEALVYRFRDQFAGRQISYQNEIAPLLKARCAFCHVENGLAPWAMNRHLMVLGWSPMMRETVITRRMPPGQIDNSVGNWENTHELSDEDMALLIEWIDQRGPRDGDIDPLAEAIPEAESWPMGQPDLIIDVPEQAIPATGNVDFLVKRAALDLPQDQWLRAVSYKVGDKSVLHSLLIYAVDKTLDSTDPDELIAADNAEFISVYVPGETDDVFADNAGFLLRANNDLVFKLRYLTSGRETTDRTQIGLYFHDSKPQRELQTLALEKDELNIPPSVREHTEVINSEPLPQDMWLTSYSPHAHSRGSTMTVSVIYPDQTEELLINVANYNYNWQLGYRLREPKLIPAGSVFRATTIYDNSTTNPFNPDPSRVVSQGYRFESEMLSHFIRLMK